MTSILPLLTLVCPYSQFCLPLLVIFTSTDACLSLLALLFAPTDPHIGPYWPLFSPTDACLPLLKLVAPTGDFTSTDACLSLLALFLFLTLLKIVFRWQYGGGAKIKFITLKAFIMLDICIMLVFLMTLWGETEKHFYNAKFFVASMGGKQQKFMKIKRLRKRFEKRKNL